MSKYKKTLNGYLKWTKGSNLFKENFNFDPNGPSAFECMKNWESNGTPITATKEPKLLSQYVQGKKSRDWHITEWKSGIKEGYFLWWEFIGTFDLSEGEIRKCLSIPQHWKVPEGVKYGTT